MRINLRKMKDNQLGTIAAVKVAGDLGRRIRDMGLVPGTEIKIQGRAPLYDRGTRAHECGSLPDLCPRRAVEERRAHGRLEHPRAPQRRPPGGRPRPPPPERLPPCGLPPGPGREPAPRAGHPRGAPAPGTRRTGPASPRAAHSPLYVRRRANGPPTRRPPPAPRRGPLPGAASPPVLS